LITERSVLKTKKLIIRLFFIVGVMASFASTAFAFNASAAKSYSDDHALNPSYEYSYYDGADCANFVSQCLHNGGMVPNSTWTYNSTAWVNANALKNYLKNGYATKIGSWSKYGSSAPYKTYAYINNSSNLTSSNAGKVVLFYDWEGDGTMNHAAFFVKNNATTSSTSLDGNVTGDLINQHSVNRKHVIWNADKRNQYRSTTRIYAFEIN